MKTDKSSPAPTNEPTGRKGDSKNPYARLIAFYLPQYHPIPENDRWWGKGFTEWRVVASAKPLFPGHRQPVIPGELGFYDLRLPEIRSAQADLARDHGIEGFCYWHYWLGNGKRLLEKPFQEVLQSGEPDFPFCLGWANHTWKGVFFGARGRTLIEQQYPGIEDHKKHFDLLLTAFHDHRYITVDGKPLLYIYKPKEIPEVKRMTDLWRELAHKNGLKGLHLVGEGYLVEDCEQFGFDAASYARHTYIQAVWPRFSIMRKLLGLYRRFRKQPAIYQYKKAMQYVHRFKTSSLNEYPPVIPNWDSTPRLGRQGVVLHQSNPELFRRFLKKTMQMVAHKPFESRIVFIKSWNEWAEGNYLEPDSKFGRAYLEAIKKEVLQ
jgi:lipopolysaccharide biosynthesis protein